MLHDIVREHAIAQHTEDERRRTQQLVVSAFAVARPPSAHSTNCGMRAWQRQPGNTCASYVATEIGHHVASSFDASAVASEIPLFVTRWACWTAPAGLRPRPR